jgi:hypothetical protein
MTKRVRLPSERELKAIQDQDLHLAIVGDLLVEVEVALAALDGALREDIVSLEVVTATLAGLLKAQTGVRTLVVEVVQLGGMSLTESETYMAMASWIIDNQIGRGFEWDPPTKPIRR